MASREHELIQELRAALLKLDEATEAEAEAKREMVARRTLRHKVEFLVREIQGEITTGRRRDPLIEYIETADERQRGPTAPAPAAEPRPADDGVTHHDAAEEALMAALAEAIGVQPGFDDVFEEFRDLGYIDDNGVYEALRRLWPSRPVGRARPAGDYIARGGDEAAFWFPVTKHWSSVVRPNLTGRRLCEAVRTVLGLPETEPVPAGKPKAEPKAKGVKS